MILWDKKNIKMKNNNDGFWINPATFFKIILLLLAAFVIYHKFIKGDILTDSEIYQEERRQEMRDELNGN